MSTFAAPKRWRGVVALAIGVLAGLLVVPASGCAALAGLDQSYFLLADGDAHDAATSAGDSAARGDGDGTTDDAAADAPATSEAGSAEAGPHAGDASSDAAPLHTWAFDETYGQGGLTALDTQASGSALPVIAVTADGGVLVAYADSANSGVLCTNPDVDAGCTQSFPGLLPRGLSTNGPRAVMLVGAANTEGLAVVDLAQSGAIYNTAGGCLFAQSLSLSASGEALVAANCSGAFEVLSFTPSDMTVTFAAVFAGSSLSNVYSATLGPASDLWLQGCMPCGRGGSAAYLHGQLGSSATLATGLVGDGTNTFSASDLWVTADGGGLLVGSYSGGASGVFATTVAAVGDSGTPVMPAHAFGLGQQQVLTTEDVGHMRMVTLGGSRHVIIGTLSGASPALVLVTVDDEGAAAAGFASAPQLLTLPGARSVLLGGAVAQGESIALALQLAFTGGSVPVAARLVMH